MPFCCGNVIQITSLCLDFIYSERNVNSLSLKHNPFEITIVMRSAHEWLIFLYYVFMLDVFSLQDLVAKHHSEHHRCCALFGVLLMSLASAVVTCHRDASVAEAVVRRGKKRCGMHIRNSLLRIMLCIMRLARRFRVIL